MKKKTSKEAFKILNILYGEDLKNPSSKISKEIKDSFRAPAWTAFLTFFKGPGKK